MNIAVNALRHSATSKTLTVHNTLARSGKTISKQNANLEAGRASQLKEWTVLKFVLKSSDLDQYLSDGSENAKGSPVRVVAAEFSENGRIEKELVDAGGRLTAEKINDERGNLAQFLKWVIKKYPSRHYIIEFDGHSTEIRPLLKKIAKEIKESGMKLDIIKFDSCTMAHADIASEFKDVADCFIASQAFSDCNSYLKKFKQWAEKNPDQLDPLEVSKKIINIDSQYTHSAVSLKEIPEFNILIKAFGGEILKIEKEDLYEFKKIIKRSQHFAQEYCINENTPLIDIRSFIKNLEESAYFSNKYPSLAASASKVKEHLSKVVIGENHIKGEALPEEYINEACGLSIFLPVKYSFKTNYLYNSRLSFWKETGWGKVMEYIT